MAEFRPALLVVDMQNDFCLPDGSLGVPGGRELAPTINSLLDLKGFQLRVATQDWHPADHVSFAATHGQSKRPFVDSVSLTNPSNAAESRNSTVWPVHCVQGSHGAEIISELDSSKFDVLVKKGMDTGMEMFSAFADIFGNKKGSSVDLKETLQDHKITHVYVVGLAGEICVYQTALDAKKEGFETLYITDGTEYVDRMAKEPTLAQLRKAGISTIVSTGPEVERVRGRV